MELAPRIHISVRQSWSGWWLRDASISREICMYSLMCCSSIPKLLHVVFIILVDRWKIITNDWFWWQTINSIIWEPLQDIWVKTTPFCDTISACFKLIDMVFINSEGAQCFPQYASKPKCVETCSLFQHCYSLNKILKRQIRKEELRIKLARVYKYVREVGTT